MPFELINSPNPSDFILPFHDRGVRSLWIILYIQHAFTRLLCLHKPNSVRLF